MTASDVIAGLFWPKYCQAPSLFLHGLQEDQGLVDGVFEAVFFFGRRLVPCSDARLSAPTSRRPR